MSDKYKTTIFALALTSSLAFAQALIEVSDKYAHIVIDETATIPRKEALGQVIYPTPNSDAYFVKISTDGPGAVVKSSRTTDLDRNDYGQMTSYGEVKGTWTKWFTFPHNYEGGIFIYVEPPKAKPTTVRMEVIRTGTRTPKQRDGLANVIRVPLDVLNNLYALPQLKVAVKPCGVVNAYSASDSITVCTELIADLTEKETAEAIPMVVLHEVGHSLLNLWGLPGWDNEDVVDEFAASLMVRARPQALQAMVKWLRTQDSLSAAAQQLSHGDRHTLPIQRARNIQRILNEVSSASEGHITPTESRWFKLLRQHAKSPEATLATTVNISKENPEEAIPAPTARTLTVANGVCERLLQGGKDTMHYCGNAVVRIQTLAANYFVVQTTNKIPLSIATGQGTSTNEGFLSFPINDLVIYHHAGEDGTESIPAHGKCIIFPSASANTLQCDLVTDKDKTLHGFRFTFKDWTPINNNEF